MGSKGSWAGVGRTGAVVAVAIGCAAAGLLAELGARALDLGADARGAKVLLSVPGDHRLAYHCYPTNPGGAFEPAPDVRSGAWELRLQSLVPERIPLDRLPASPWCVRYDRSPQGLRDRSYPLDPPGGAPSVVAVVGDSFTLGEGVALPGTLSRTLERVSDGRVKFLNAGSSGAALPEEIVMLEKLRDRLGVRRAIVVYVLNDVPLDAALEAEQSSIHDLINVRAGAAYGEDESSSRFVAFVRRTLRVAEAGNRTIAWYAKSYDPEHNAVGLRRLERQLARLAKIEDVEVLLVVYPLLESLDDYAFEAAHARVAQMAEAAGLPVLDLQDAFRGRDAANLWVHPIDHHPNGEANRIAADAIHAWLKAHHSSFLRPVTRTPDR